MNLQIVWRNPFPPGRRSLRVAEIAADESTAAPMWLIRYLAISDSGSPKSEYELLVNHKVEPVAV